MRPPAPRRTWTWACAACLAALAGALFWPASDIPRLRVFPDREAAPSVGKPLEAPEDRTGLARKEDGVPPPAALPVRDEAARDAVADAPGRLAVQRTDWTQAPWRAVWGVRPRETASVPVPQSLPPVYRRASSGRPRAMPSASAERILPREGPRHGPAARPSTPEPPPPEPAPTPARALKRMREVFARVLSYRTSAGSPSRSGAASAGWLSRRGPGPGRTPDVRSRTPKGRPAEAPAARPPRWNPVLLSQALGARAIRPPTLKGRVPDLRRLLRLFPKKGPDGRPLRWSPAPAAALEKLKPPEAEAAKCRRASRHWHPGLPAFHSGRAWAVSQAEGWAWLERTGRRWWAWTAPQEPVWLRHEDHWWWRSQDVWFMLHQGEAWGYRIFDERRTEGLVHPGSGARLEYSADGERVALIEPGDGAWLFDARSGAVLGRWSEEQMPKRPKPRAPSALSFPR